MYPDEDGFPRNPFGRTGLTGRGLLGRWGPNRAIDAIVTRWKRDVNGQIIEENQKRVLEFIAIKRQDVDEWSVTGVSVFFRLEASYMK